MSISLQASTELESTFVDILIDFIASGLSSVGGAGGFTAVLQSVQLSYLIKSSILIVVVALAVVESS